jgi:transglutaminase-like putative cysteine protease
VSTAPRYRICHETHYHYAASVVHAHQLLHLTPRTTIDQTCSEHHIEVTPTPARRYQETDPFGNTLTRLEIDRPHRELKVVAMMTLDVEPRHIVAADETLPWERVRDELSYSNRPRSERELEASMYRMESPHARIKSVFSDFAANCFGRSVPVLVGAEDLMNKIHEQFEYAPGKTYVGISLTEVLEQRRGVCQDFAHLMIACLRSQGLAARYVSGYLRTTPSKDAPLLTGADASHAWVSVYAPPFGWIDLDPTNQLVVGTDHITLAWGRDFGDVSPLRGVIVGGGQHSLHVGVDVRAG